MDAGISIGAQIAIRGFTNLVLDGEGCHSICAVIWVSGVRRYMSPDADIRVHAAYWVEDSKESGVANARIGAYLNELGLSRVAIEYFTTARPGEELLPVTPEIAQAWTLTFAFRTVSGLSRPADRPTPRRIARQVTDLAVLANNCVELLRGTKGEWHEQAEKTFREGHDFFGGETFIPFLPEFLEISKAGMQRDGTVRWCLSAEAASRKDGIETGVTGPGFDCGTAGTPTEVAICGSQDL
ncbi:hypothetical protein [Paenirhodobacter sp.]|uniref:hypothetical protein n=1 Tax=Paenirhodobacter sp. TaxID=1965326 RepID=UPI003B3ED0CB